MTQNERIKKIINHYCSTQQEFANKLGKTKQWVSNLVSEGFPIGVKTTTVIIEAFPNVNPNWILFETGDMFLDPSKENIGVSDASNGKLVQYHFINVPLIPVRARAGYLEGYGDPEYISEMPMFPVITDRTFHGTYRCFEVEGDSMNDGTMSAIMDGDVILGREVQRDLWRNKLHLNQWKYYAIVHKDGILIKQIVSHDTANGTIKCHSLNNIYGDDFILNLDDVYELYNLIRIVDRPVR